MASIDDDEVIKNSLFNPNNMIRNKNVEGECVSPNNVSLAQSVDSGTSEYSSINNNTILDKISQQLEYLRCENQNGLIELKEEIKGMKKDFNALSCEFDSLRKNAGIEPNHPIIRDVSYQNYNHLNNFYTNPRISDNANNNNHSMRPPQYDGIDDFEEYIAQFETVCHINRWSYNENSLYLACSLTGNARAILTELSQFERRDFNILVRTLRIRFGWLGRSEMYRARLQSRYRGKTETLSELAQSIRKLTKQAYPTADSSITKILALDHFIDSIQDSNMRLRIHELHPTDIDEAEIHAIRLEAHELVDGHFGHSVHLITPHTEPLCQAQFEIRPEKYDDEIDISTLNRSINSLENTTGHLVQALSNDKSFYKQPRQRNYCNEHHENRNNNHYQSGNNYNESNNYCTSPRDDYNCDINKDKLNFHQQYEDLNKNCEKPHNSQISKSIHGDFTKLSPSCISRVSAINDIDAITNQSTGEVINRISYESNNTDLNEISLCSQDNLNPKTVQASAEIKPNKELDRKKLSCQERDPSIIQKENMGIVPLPLYDDEICLTLKQQVLEKNSNIDLPNSPFLQVNHCDGDMNSDKVSVAYNQSANINTNQTISANKMRLSLNEYDWISSPDHYKQRDFIWVFNTKLKDLESYFGQNRQI